MPVCGACLRRVSRNTLFGCEQCGEAIDLDLDLEDMRFAGLAREGFLCRGCRMVPPAFARAVAYCAYDDEMRTLVHLLKYERVRGVAGLMASRLGAAMLELEPVAARELLVVAVPLFRERERERGYNQSVLLADAAVRWMRGVRPGWKLERAHGTLVRQRRTESQYALSPKGRRRNLRGAFHVRGDVKGREVLLVDDILTSGATARECAQVLVAAGAAKVWVATLVRAQKRRVQRQHEDPGELVAAWDMPVARG